MRSLGREMGFILGPKSGGPAANGAADAMWDLTWLAAGAVPRGREIGDERDGTEAAGRQRALV